LEELEDNLPNGFHDAEIFSLELNYGAGTAKFRMNLLVGWPDDAEPERDSYQEASLVVYVSALLILHLRNTHSFLMASQFV
jgi:hypothetical protein